MTFDRSLAIFGISAIAIPALVMTISQNAIAQTIAGQGTLSLQGRPDREIVSATIATDAGNRTEMAFQLSDGNTIRFTGRYQGQTDSTQIGVIAIRITNSGNADASGVVRVTYVDGTISQIAGEGYLDSQNFNLQFNRGVTSTNSNAAQEGLGQGTLEIQGRPPLSITHASVLTYADARTEITLQLSNGNVIPFTGEYQQQSPESSPNLLPVILTNSGNADASGTLNITYRDNSVQSISGRGSLDGQVFRLNYTRQP